MARTLVVSAIIGLVYYGIWYWIMGRDKFKASILAITSIIFTFSYDEIYNFYHKLTDETHLYFVLLLVLITAVIAFFVRTKLKSSRNLRNYLAIFATILLLLNLYPLVKHWVTNFGLTNLPFGADIKVAREVPGQSPDIYYLVFDRYANHQVLKNTYNFDNRPFLKSLRDKGFYVAGDSTANYPFTTMSLTTSMNLDYIPKEFNDRSASGLYYTLLKDKMENNKAALFLKNQGYSFINIGPWWTATKYNRNADQDLYYPTGLILFNKKVDLQEHELILLQETIFWPFFSKLPLKWGPHEIYGLTLPVGKESPKRVIHRETALHQFETIKQVSKQTGPKFVFAHLLFPHDPYVLDAKCNTFQARYKDEYAVYLNQLECANIKILETVDQILKNSKNDPPIIIVQADEGPYPKAFRKNTATYEWKKAPVELLHQKAKILNAYYFPDKNYKKLYPDISPVNSFRLIFNQYLGTNLPLLEDRHYFSESEKRRFYFFEVTNKF